MDKKRKYRSIDQIDEAYYRNHPDEIGFRIATGKFWSAKKINVLKPL